MLSYLSHAHSLPHPRHSCPPRRPAVDRPGHRPKWDEALAALTAEGLKAIAVAGDVTDPKAVTEIVAAVQQQLGRIDILVNNAGMSIRKPPHVLALEEWETVMKTNLTSAFL